jgi:DNA excision repair protein ERCC-5
MQAAALNKQSDLNSFFDVNVGTGTYAPRNRKAYTSKRLQQVVTDFRNKRKRDSASPTSTPTPHSPSESASEDEATRTNRRKVTKGKGVAQASTSRGSRRGRGRQGGRGASSRKKSRATMSDDHSDDSEFPASGGEGCPEIPPDPVVVARLRPRPKPRPAFKGAREVLDEPDHLNGPANAV